LGTAHAVTSYFDEVKSAKDQPYTFILCGDTPCVEVDDFAVLWNAVKDNNLDAACAVFATQNPFGLGRIIKHSQGFEIREEKEASEEEKKIQVVNSGFYLVRTEYLLGKLKNIDKSENSGEFYLTDLFQKNEKVSAIEFSKAENFYGVNTQSDLEIVSKVLNRRICQKWQDQGVRFIDSSTTYVDDQVVIGSGCVIHPQVFLQGQTVLKKDVVVESGCVVKNSIIETNAFIKAHCYLDEAIVHSQAQVGPFAHLRPGSDIGEQAKIGNFVEIKKSQLAKGSKVSHLSYVGDASIGERTNIGCGFITCNYDGKNKHKTIIGKDAFIGSDSQTIAPITIGDGAYVGSGSTINQDVGEGDFAIARAKQTILKGGAKRFTKK